MRWHVRMCPLRYEHYEQCLVACLRLGGKVVAAAALRLTLPTSVFGPDVAARCYVETVATHLQVGGWRCVAEAS